MNDGTGFGTLLRSLRLAAGLSQESLAERARLSAESISALERGARRAPYRETVRLLADALDLTGAHRAQLEAAAVRPARPRAAGAKEPHHNLPLALTSFHGRERERAALPALLDDRRLITLTGPGGVGKTRLALETAAQHMKRFAGGVWFVELARLRSEAPVAAAIAAVLHVRERAATPTEKALVTKLQAAGDTLLVIDNCEHVLESTARVVELLVSSCPRVHVLATSREPLRIGGEQLFAVGPLAPAPAERMFVDRAAAVGGDVDLAHDSASVASIVRRLDGLPLALELAAARLRSLSPQQIADALDARFHILTEGSRTALPRHQTLRATLEWSHDLLSQREREVFRRCSIFAGTWTLAAAQPVCARGTVGERDVAAHVMSLVDKSLIVATRDVVSGASRFTMLETTRRYALEHLEESGEHRVTAQRHFEHVKAVVESANAAYEATGSDEQLAALWPELDNLRLALDWSLANGDALAGAALGAASGRLWHRIGLSSEGIRRLHALASAIGAYDTPLSARLWTALSCLQFSSAHMTASFEAAERAVALARAQDDLPTLILALLEFGDVAARLQRSGAAAAAVDEAAHLAGPAPPGLQRARLLGVRAVMSALRGDFDAATAAFGTALEIYRRLGDEYGQTTVIMNLAEAQHACGDTVAAIVSVRGRLPFSFRELDRERHVTLLTNLTGYQAAIGDCAGARAAACEALTLCAESDPGSPWVAVTLEHLALALVLDGEGARAALLAGYCDPALAACGYVREFTEQTTHDRLSAALRERFSEAELRRFADEGAAFSTQRAIGEGLRASS